MSIDTGDYSLRAGTFLHGKQPGVNVDKVDRASGVKMAAHFGWDSAEDAMVVDYAVWKHGHGEEAGAQKLMLEHGIDLTVCYAIIAAARAGAET